MLSLLNLERSQVLLGVFVIIAILIIARLAHLQLFTESEIGDRRSPINAKLFERGDIYFTNKNGEKVLVATTQYGRRLVISPRELDDIDEAYGHINAVLPINEATFYQKANLVNDGYEIIQKQLPSDVVGKLETRIRRYGLKGVSLEEEAWRVYPFSSLAAHVIGYVGFDDRNVYQGQYGLENSYDTVLSQRQRNNIDISDVIRGSVSEEGARGLSAGGDIVASIDVQVQKKLQSLLREISTSYQSQKVGGIVLEPNTGRVVAMASMPTFDLNNFQAEKDHRVYNNPFIADVYEMGSVFKPLTIAIGLDSRRVSVNDTYDDTGSIVVDGKKVSNYDGRARGKNISLQSILSQSLNLGAAFVVLKTGVPVYRSYFNQFSFDTPTGIDLPREIGGLIDNLNTKRTIEYVTASYGHGIAVTPIAATRALSSLANGGYLVRPMVVQETILQGSSAAIIGGGAIKSIKQRVFKKSTTETVTNFLVNVYDKALLGGALRNPHYSIASKTGTAQLVDSKTGKYLEDKILHSFFGYFPASNPKYSIFLFTVDPKGARYASDSLARPFSKLANYLISYYALPPDR